MIHILSEQQCYKMLKNGDLAMQNPAVISIRDYDKPIIKNLRTFQGVLDVLYLNFEDVTSGENSFTSEDAKIINKFITKNAKKTDTFVVHCFAGQSRSYAIGLYISKVLKIELKLYTVNAVPNALVMTLLENSKQPKLKF